jgi:hypothetical protein
MKRDSIQKLFYSACLSLTICTSSLGSSLDYLNFNDDSIVIDHDIIKLIDGTSRIDIHKILKLEMDIHEIQTLNKITYQGKKYRLNDLVDLEKEAKKKLQPYQVAKQFKDALLEATNQFDEASKPYLIEARKFKPQMCKLMKRWTDQLKIKSILNEWANQTEGEEIEQLKKLAKSLSALNKLLTDLSLFLKDLRFSCKKSWMAYTDRIKQIRSKKHL